MIKSKKLRRVASLLHLHAPRHPASTPKNTTWKGSRAPIAHSTSVHSLPAFYYLSCLPVSTKTYKQRPQLSPVWRQWQSPGRPRGLHRGEILHADHLMDPGSYPALQPCNHLDYKISCTGLKRFTWSAIFIKFDLLWCFKALKSLLQVGSHHSKASKLHKQDCPQTLSALLLTGICKKARNQPADPYMHK